MKLMTYSRLVAKASEDRLFEGDLVMKINADAVGLAVLSLSTSGALLLVPDLSLASLPAS